MKLNSLKDIYMNIKKAEGETNYNEAYNEITLTKEDYEIKVLEDDNKIINTIIFNSQEYTYVISNQNKYNEEYKLLLGLKNERYKIYRENDNSIRIHNWRNKKLSKACIVKDISFSFLGTLLLFSGFMLCLFKSIPFNNEWSKSTNFIITLITEMIIVFTGTILMSIGSQHIIRRDTIIYFRLNILLILLLSFLTLILFIDKMRSFKDRLILSIIFIVLFVPIILRLLLLCFDTIIEKDTEA
ncbi:MAG: hypothetical protein IJ224_05390 [Lachnospiraceae bacterium]|nr:hypothetical protein [Lachnospiraceae bacterium]